MNAHETPFNNNFNKVLLDHTYSLAHFSSLFVIQKSSALTNGPLTHQIHIHKDLNEKSQTKKNSSRI